MCLPKHVWLAIILSCIKPWGGGANFSMIHFFMTLLPPIPILCSFSYLDSSSLFLPPSWFSSLPASLFCVPSSMSILPHLVSPFNGFIHHFYLSNREFPHEGQIKFFLMGFWATNNTLQMLKQMYRMPFTLVDMDVCHYYWTTPFILKIAIAYYILDNSVSALCNQDMCFLRTFLEIV